MIQPGAFNRRTDRDEWRRILVACENGANIIAREPLTEKKRIATANLIQALIKASRMQCDEIDRLDPLGHNPEVQDFDTSLRAMLDADGETTTEGAPS